jgi:polyisoprenoid-binding protein YceI
MKSAKAYFSSGRSLLLAMIISLVPMVGSAQQNSPWRIDQQHSVARLSLGTGANSLEVGIARVGGSALFDPANPGDARLAFTILDDQTQTSQHSQITFTSKRSWVRSDGNLLVAGDLSVTRVVRIVQLDPNEGYNGAQYGAPIAYTNSTEVTLVFPRAKSAGSQDGAFQLLSGSTIVSAEDLPLLQAALQSGDWPRVLVDRQSVAPSTIGEDYAGFATTGTAVVTVTNSVVTGTGDGYYGSRPAVEPDARKAMIALDLRFTRSTAVDSGEAPSFGN